MTKTNKEKNLKKKTNIFNINKNTKHKTLRRFSKVNKLFV